MIKPLPTGAISLDAAVEMMVRHKCPGPGVILRDDGEEAFRELCKLVLDKRVHPRGQTLDGKTFKARRDQFIDLQERYIFMAAALRYTAGVEGLGIEDPPSYELFDADGNRYRYARLVFRESELEGELASVSEPTGDSPEVATWPETPSFDEVYEADKSPVPVFPESCGENVEETPLVENVVVEEPVAAGDEANDDIEAVCCKWVAALPEDRPITKKEARERFNRLRQNRKHIGTRAFNRVWKKSAPLSWHAPGRRPGT